MVEHRDSASQNWFRQRVLAAFYGNFAELRSIQDQSFEPIRIGQDVLVLSPTGSGKTEAAVAPLITRWYRLLRAESSPIILYISPTKALTNDLAARLSRPCDELGIRIGVRHGDRSDLNRNSLPGLLITTPESLDILLSSRDGSLQNIRSVVVDEIHLLYNTQRGLQLSILLSRLERHLTRTIQMIAMSATVANSRELLTFFLGTRSARNPLVVSDPSRKPIRSHIRTLSRPGQLPELIARLTNQRATKLLVFANSRRECDAIGAQLSRSDQLPPTFVHYSSLSTENREVAERRFAQERSAICVATSTLELGIDIGDVDAVLLYGVPPSVESFLQRVGRGCRRADESNVICLVPPSAPRPVLDMLAYIAILNRAKSGSMLSDSAFNLFGAAAQQILSHMRSLGGGYIRESDFASLFESFPHLDAQAVSQILAELTARNALTRHGFKNRFAPGEEFHRLEFLRLIHSNYPAGSQTVDLICNGHQLGRIPAINLLRLEAGDVLRFAGRTYGVKRLERGRLHVEPATARRQVVEVLYLGKRPGLHPQILEDIADLLRTWNHEHDAVAPADRSSLERIAGCLRPRLEDGLVPIVSSTEGLRHLTFGGGWFNAALSAWSGGDASKADDLCVIDNRTLRLSELPQSLEELPAISAKTTRSLFQSMLPAELGVREDREVWLKTGAHARTLDRLRRSKTCCLDSTDLAGLL